MNACIIGIGMHPFGRHDTEGREQGVYAVQQALRDAGIGWSDVQFAFGGSDAAGNPDTMVADLGLTGIPFVNVKNGCATGGTALTLGVQALEAGAGRHRRGRRLRQASARRVQRPAGGLLGLADWYGETGLMLTTQFFAMKIQRYMPPSTASRTSTLARVAEKAFAQRRPERERVAAQASDRGGDPGLADGQRSADEVHVLLAGRGRRGVGALLRQGRADGSRTGRSESAPCSCASRRFGSFEVFSPVPGGRARA